MALLTLKFVTDVRDLDYEVVEFYGELDQSTLPNTEKQMSDLLDRLAETTRVIIFDFGNLTYTNSEGIAFIVSTHARLTKKGMKLFLAHVQPNVADVFEVIGLGKLIPTFHTVPDAVAFMKKK